MFDLDKPPRWSFMGSMMPGGKVWMIDNSDGKIYETDGTSQEWRVLDSPKSPPSPSPEATGKR